MKPMPPASCVKGARRVGREASFDPLRGAFIVLARPDDPEPNPPERRRGLGAAGSSKEPGQVKALLVSRGEGEGCRTAAQLAKADESLSASKIEQPLVHMSVSDAVSSRTTKLIYFSPLFLIFVCRDAPHPIIVRRRKQASFQTPSDP